MAIELQKDVDVDSLHEVFNKEAKSKMKGIINVSCEPLVSVDYIGNSHSAIIDGLSTKVINKRFIKLVASYDKEYGFSSPVLDLHQYLPGKMAPSTPSK